MKKHLLIYFFLFYHFLLFSQSKVDTTFIKYSKSMPLYVSRNKAYHQTLTMKLFLSKTGWEGEFKRKDAGESTVVLNLEQALDVIKRMDGLTLGIPKIVYLVGWQYNGHDSKYPAWFEGNEKLKRKEDKNALESIKWLMTEAKKHNTTVSLHINMFDAYEDSPLWDIYTQNNIIAKNKDGSLRACEWGYPISYAQEWKTGYAQKRIDSLCQLLPIQKAGTIHIDAFHTFPPVPVQDSTGKYRLDFTPSVISPFLPFSIDDETEAQRQIYRYWASKGVDVTCEGVNFLRKTDFEGYQPMAWWYGGLENYLKFPATYYCGGQDRSEWGKLFGTSIHGEDIIVKDYKVLPNFKAEFCKKTLLWYYLNRLKRLYLVQSKNFKSLQYSENVKSYLSADSYKVTQGEAVLLENDDMLIPALWLPQKALIAYSKNGFLNKKWKLPKEMKGAKRLKIYTVSQEGKTFTHIIKVQKGEITLSLKNDEMLLLEDY